LWTDVRGRRRLADFLIDAIAAAGTTHVFGMPAESLNGIMDALRKHATVEVITVRHEGNAALMASAYGKLTGRLGVCIGTAGPGETHLPIGTYDAKLDGAPMLAICGQVPIHQMGSGGFQEIDSEGLFRDSVYSTRTISSVTQTTAVLLACAEALYRRQPTHLAFPNDVLRTALVGKPTIRIDPSVFDARVEPTEETLAAAAARLDAEGGPAVVVVGAVDGERAGVVELSERLGAPLLVAAEGFSFLRDAGDAPYELLLQREPCPARDVVAGARRVVVVGSISARTARRLPRGACVVHVASARSRPAPLLPGSLRVLGDEGSSCRRLAEAVAPAADRVDAEEAIRRHREEVRTTVAGSEFWRAFDAAAPADAVVAVEPGAVLDSALVHLPLRARTLTSSFGHGARAYAVPAAIAATVADPARAAFAVATDEGLAEAMPDLLTALKYALPIKVVCFEGEDAAIDFQAFARSAGMPAVRSADGAEDAVGRLVESPLPALVALDRGLAAAAEEPAVAAPATGGAGTLARRLVDLLALAGASHVYLRPRPALRPLLDAIADRGSIAAVPVVHPESASMMASANSKWTGRLSVCIAADEPDLVYSLNGLFDAHYDRSKIVVVTPPRAEGPEALDPRALLAPLAARWVAVTPRTPPAEIETALHEALRVGDVVHLEVRWEDLGEPVDELPPWLAPAPAPEAVTPPPERIAAAAERLAAASSPAILVGRGAYGAHEEVARLAALLDAPVATTMPGRGVLPDTHPAVIGGVGASGHLSAIKTLEACDVLLALGTSNRGAIFGLRGGFLQVQIDHDPLQLGRRAQETLGLHGDVRETTRLLLEALEARGVRGAPATADGRVKTARSQLESFLARAGRPRRTTPPILPSSVCHTLRRTLDELGQRAILTVDVGLTTLWVYRHFVGDHDVVWTSSFATMGFALPAAIALKELEPDRPVVAMVGDGGIGITMAEFATAVRRGVHAVAVVFNNGKLGAIKFEQEVMGWPEFESELTNCDFAAYARAAGGAGILVEQPRDLADALRQALTVGAACIVDVRTDPNELPGPPKIHPLQAAGYVVARTREAKGAVGARIARRRLGAAPAGRASS
jgi:thiamine pyrophosphate-dependent acetolactate synthase large subunit-like protein